MADPHQPETLPRGSNVGWPLVLALLMQLAGKRSCAKFPPITRLEKGNHELAKQHPKGHADASSVWLSCRKQASHAPGCAGKQTLQFKQFRQHLPAGWRVHRFMNAV